jgi:hypothetical protein
MERPPSPSASDRERSRFLARLEAELARADRDYFLAWWDLYVRPGARGTAASEMARTRLLARPELREFITHSLERPLDPLLERRLQLLQRIVEDALIEQAPPVVQLRGAMMRTIVRFRPKYRGRRRSRAEVSRLSEDPDPAVRRDAHWALDELHRQVEPGLRRLVRVRNELARGLGYRSFPDFRLRTEGLTEARFQTIVSEVVDRTRPYARRLADQVLEGMGKDLLEPWDLWYSQSLTMSLPPRAFPGGQMTASAFRAIRGWGFRGPSNAFRIVRRSIPTGGMTLSPQLPRDVRVVVNPSGGWTRYMILIHEFGHAVQDWYTRGPTHLLRGPENIPGFAGFHEGMGGLFESLASESAWLATRPGVSREQRETLAARRSVVEGSGALHNALWVQREIEIYRSPEGNLVERFRRIDSASPRFHAAARRSFGEPFWVELGFYGKSYLLATLVAAQLRREMSEELRGPIWPNPRVIPWLARTWFRHGVRYDWVPRIAEVTGRQFGVADYARMLRTGFA